MRTLDPARVAEAVDRAYRDLDVELPWQQRLQRWIQEIIGRILDFAGENQVVGGLVLLAIAVLVVWFVTWALRRGLVRDIDLATGAGPDDDVDWDAMAREAEQRGDLDGALRAGYRALIADLVGRGWVPDRRSLTAAEARAAMQDRRAHLAGAVADATTAFERVAYARKAVEVADVEAIRRARQEVAA